MNKLWMLVLTGLVGMILTQGAFAQGGAVRILLPTAAGGPSDIAARALGQVLSKNIGQPVVIENRPGANGAIATHALVGAPTDGSVLLWALASMSTIPMLQKSPPFASLADYVPVSLVAVSTFALFAHPGVPASNAGELIAHLRANPDKLSYASASLAEYLAAASLLRGADAIAVRVPYRSGPQAMQDLVAGRVQFQFAPIGLGLSHAKEGKLRLVAVLASARSALAQEVPTMAEAGFPNVAVPTWQALLAPAGTPTAVAERFAQEVDIALRDTALRGQLERIGMQVRGEGPVGLANAIARDTELWRDLVRLHEVPKE